MDFKYSLNETLEARFDELDEVMDISTHGANTGVSGFTYTWEINEFFNEFEDEIENYYYEIFGDSWLNELSHSITSLDELRAKMVWGLVEMWCSQKVDEEAIVA